jgi:hypothetical protein
MKTFPVAFGALALLMMALDSGPTYPGEPGRGRQHSPDDTQRR